MQFRLGELFCGAGGLAWGAINAGRDCPIEENGERYSILHAWANDLDVSACRTYAANIVQGGDDTTDLGQLVITAEEWVRRHGDTQVNDLPTVICGSVEKVTDRVENLAPIDAFAFGFPCNDFSTVGERKGLDGDFGPLYSHGIKVLNHHRPRWFVAENVAGLLHREKGQVIKQIRSELEQAGPGYVLTEHLYRFEQYGVPQSRTRLVIVGISRPDNRNGIIFRVPAPTTETDPRTAEWALGHEPTNPTVPKPIPVDAANHVPKPISDRVRSRLEHTLPGQNAWNANIPPEFALKVKKAHLSMIYRRLVANEPSYTITGNGGGGTHGYHWAEPRALTNRERARLQSFPDAFIFKGGEESVRRQVGMAVPPLAAVVIFEAILKSYARIDYPFVPACIGETARRQQNAMETSGSSHLQTQMELAALD